MADETASDRTLADGEHRPLRLRDRPGNPRMEQRDSTRPESRRDRLANDEGRREETVHVFVVPPTEVPEHRPRIFDGPSKPTVHQTEPPRDALHELYQADGAVQSGLDPGERQASCRTEYGGQRCNSCLSGLERDLG